MRKLAALVVCPLLLACTFRRFDADSTHHEQAAQVAGSCFELKLDAYVHVGHYTVPLTKPTPSSFEVDGYFVWNPDTASAPENGLLLAKGARLVVERVLTEYQPMNGTIWHPYARLRPEYQGLLVDASSLFNSAIGDDESVTPVAAFLQPCGR